MELNRQSGRSTKQMISAPAGSLYVVHTFCSVSYYKELAKKNGREDLIIIAPYQIRDYSIGRKISGIVIDHVNTEYFWRQFSKYWDDYLTALSRIY